MNTPTRDTDFFADLHLQMAQRGRLFKQEPQAVVRELPRATGLRVLQVGDVVRERSYPDLIYPVVELRVEDGWQVAMLWDAEHRKARPFTQRYLARAFEHADGAGIEARP